MDYDEAEAILAKAFAGPPYNMDDDERKAFGAAMAWLLVDAVKSLDVLARNSANRSE